MTLQINDMSLIQNGFKMTAEYQLWNRYDEYAGGKWMPPTTIKCFQKDNECVCKIYHNRKSFTKVFSNKIDANDYIKYQLDICDSYKKLN